MGELMNPGPEDFKPLGSSRKESNLRRMMMKVGVGTGMLVGLLGIGGRMPRAEASPAQSGTKQVELSPAQERLMRERAIRVTAATQVFKATNPELVRVEIGKDGTKRERFEGQFDPSRQLSDLIQNSERLSGKVSAYREEGKSFREDYSSIVKNIGERFSDIDQDLKNSIVMGLGRIFGLSSGNSREPLMIGERKIENIQTAGDLAEAVSLTAREVWSRSEGMKDGDRLELTQSYIESAANVGVAGAQEALSKAE